MSKIKNSLVAFGFFLALFVFTSSASYAQGAKPPSDVNVINIPNVNVANTPNVNIANTPGVSIVNTESNPALVRNADDPASHAFQAELTIVMNPGEFAGSDRVVVPAGKRLVIEYLTIEALLPAGQNAKSVVINTRVAGRNTAHRIHPLPTSIAGVFAADKLVRIYADSGNPFEVSFAAFRDGGNDSATFSVSLTGYLVDMQ